MGMSQFAPILGKLVVIWISILKMSHIHYHDSGFTSIPKKCILLLMGLH